MSDVASELLPKLLTSIANAGPVATVLGVWLWSEKKKAAELVQSLEKKEEDLRELTGQFVELSTKQELGFRLMNERLKTVDDSIKLKELLKEASHG